MNNFPKHLLQGYHQFVDGRYAKDHQTYHQLAKGQAPTTMVIACCDSRAAPETIFDCGPGELFVVRNVANLVHGFAPDGGQYCTSAGIEFAVKGLGVQHIIVMGHARCGGINAALNRSAAPLDAGDFIGKWISLLDPVTAQFADNGLMTADERQTALERISIHNSITNLRTFPYVCDLEAQGKLSLHGAWFDIKSGELWVMNDETGEFAQSNA